jgi:glycosyltransferase involved in cell wall biosynthesis
MKALFYNHTGRASGAEKVLLLALEHLDRTAVEPLLVCPPGELAGSAEKLDIPVKYISELNARITLWPHKLAWYAISLIKTVFALRTEVRRSRCDVVHANSPRGGIAAIFATAGWPLPVIWHVHDEFIPHPITSLIRLLVLVCGRCSVIAVSEATAISFVGKSSKLARRVQVIHNAVDVNGIDKNSSSGSLRQELRLEPNDFLFGIVGQITPRKGQLELIGIFAQAVKEMPAAKLLVIGAPVFDHDDDYHEEVVRLTASLDMTNRVLFLGRRPDAIEIIKQLDTLVINSKSEAFVMVGIEAMACRTPVIATNVGGTREMITHGINGLLLPAGDKEALAAALKQMYADANLRELFVERSRDQVEKELNIDLFVSEFQKTLLNLAPGEVPKAGSIEIPLDAIRNS